MSNTRPQTSQQKDAVEFQSSIRAGFALGEIPSSIHAEQILYRGDTRDFNNIFKEGFTSRGKNTDIVKHAFPPDNTDYFPDSAYISTTRSKEVAVEFPYPLRDPGVNPTYVYEIKSTRPTINLTDVITKIGKNLNDEDFLKFDSEEERAFRDKIKPEEIKGCWEVEIIKNDKILPEDFKRGKSQEFINYISYEYERSLRHQYIPNPNFIAPTNYELKIWKAGRFAGHALMGAGIFLDGERIYNQAILSDKTGDYNNTYLETEGIAGGWAGAFSAGAYAANRSASLCTPLPLYGRAACTILGGLAGSAVGYYCGSNIATKMDSILVNTSFKFPSLIGNTHALDYSDDYVNYQYPANNSLKYRDYWQSYLPKTNQPPIWQQIAGITSNVALLVGARYKLPVNFLRHLPQPPKLYNLIDQANTAPPYHNDYGSSIVRGIGTGIQAVAHSLCHPFDTIIYPTYRFLTDLQIASVKNSHLTPNVGYMYDGSDFLSSLVVTHPQAVIDAKMRMQERVQSINEIVSEVINGTGPQRAEIAAHFTTSYLLGGYASVSMIRSLQKMSNIFHRPTKPTFFDIGENISYKPGTETAFKNALAKVYGDDMMGMALKTDWITIREPDIFLWHQKNRTNIRDIADIYTADGKLVRVANTQIFRPPHGKYTRSAAERIFFRSLNDESTARFFKHFSNESKPKSTGNTNRINPNQSRFSHLAGAFNMTSNRNDLHHDIAINLATTTVPTPVLDYMKHHHDLDTAARQAEVEKNAFFESMQLKAAAAQKAQAELNNIIQKPAFLFTNESRQQLNEIAKPIQEFGEIATKIGTLSRLAGIHARTARGITMAGEGLSSLGSGLSTLAASKSMLSLSAISGGLSVAIGVMAIAVSILGQDDEQQDAFGPVKEMLQAIHRDMLYAAQHLEKTITENMAVVIQRLNQLNAKSDRLERISGISFKELHSKDLIDTCDAIRKEMTGEFTLTDAKKEKYVQRLSTWMDHHSRAQIQTSILRDDKDISKCVEILSSDDFDIMAMLPFFIAQLMKFLPANIIPNVKMEEIPNIVVLASICEIYGNAVTRYQFNKNYAACLERAKTRIQHIIEVINSIQKNEEITDLLFRQYEEARYQVGRCIEKCRADFADYNDQALQRHLKNGINTENLMLALDQLELRRIILNQLAQLCDFQGEKLANIQKLESKKDILAIPVNSIKANEEKLFSMAGKSDFVGVKRVLALGGDINAWDGSKGYGQNFGGGGPRAGAFGQPVHHLARDRGEAYYSLSANVLHLFCKSNSFEMNNGTWVRYGTWGENVRPIQWMLNSGHFELAIILCANGYDISEAEVYPACWHGVMNTDFCNAYQWARNGDIQCIIQNELVKEMNSESSPINKKALRKAYQVYKMIEAGVEVSMIDVSKECMLLLVAILGDLKPLKMFGIPMVISNLAFNVNKPLTKSGFTYLMLAACCGKEEVVRFLMLSMNASQHTKTTFLSNELSPALALAKTRKFTIVQEILNDPLADPIKAAKIRRAEKVAQSPDQKNAPKLDNLNAFSAELTSKIASIAATPNREAKTNDAAESSENKNKLKTLLQRIARIHSLLNKYCLTLGNDFDDNIKNDLEGIKSNIAKAESEIDAPKKIVETLQEVIAAYNMLDAELKLNPSYKLTENVMQLIKEIDINIKSLNEGKKSASPLIGKSIFRPKPAANDNDDDIDDKPRKSQSRKDK